VKIVHVITRLILGGAQENTLFTVEGLGKDPKNDVVLITGPAIGPEGDLIERARSRGVNLVVIDQMRRAVHPWRDLATLVNLTRLLARLKPDVVHTHSSKAGIQGRWAAWFVGVPIIVHTIHGMPFHPYEKPYLNFLYKTAERLTAPITDRFITVCNAMIEAAVAGRVAPREKFQTVYSGIEVDDFLDDAADGSSVRRSLGIADDVVVIGKIARLFELKGHDYVIDSAPAVIERYPNVKYLFIGDGILRERLVEKIERMGLADRFVFAGLIPPQQVPAYIKAMDVLVHCSLREGLARVLPQAMASAKPVICFDLDGASEVVADGVTGYLVRPESVKDLTEKTLQLLSERARWTDMGAEGRALVTEKFRVEKMVSDIQNLYDELAACKHVRNAEGR